MIVDEKEVSPGIKLQALSSGHHQSATSILIPLHVVESSTDTEIAFYVRQMVECAQIVEAISIADYLLTNSGEDVPLWVLEQYADKLAMLERFAGRDSLIDQALAAAEATRQRELYKVSAPGKRKEIRNKYKYYYGALIERDSCLCAYCGATDKLHIDHVVAVANGGTNDLSNLQLLCAACNMEKSDKP